jgi:hypothetical protein
VNWFEDFARPPLLPPKLNRRLFVSFLYYLYKLGRGSQNLPSGPIL